MSDPRIRDEAALWMTRARDPRFADWDGLTAWLERDPAHNLAYEEAFAAHDFAGSLAGVPSRIRIADENAHARAGARRFPPQRWLVAGALGSVVAAAALVLFDHQIPGKAPVTAIETLPGHRRSVRLEDGTQVALNGGSRILLYPSVERRVSLDRGEAMFDVVHDPRHPFTVELGSTRLVDLGTRFDVVRGSARTEVAVAEGAVLYDPAGANVRLGRGELLTRKEGSQVVEIARLDPDQIGRWRNGTLVYDGAPLARVAEDLQRATGWNVTVDRSAAERSYSGTIRIDGADKGRLARRLGSLLDLQVASRPDGLYLKARESR